MGVWQSFTNFLSGNGWQDTPAPAQKEDEDKKVQGQSAGPTVSVARPTTQLPTVSVSDSLPTVNVKQPTTERLSAQSTYGNGRTVQSLIDEYNKNTDVAKRRNYRGMVEEQAAGEGRDAELAKILLSGMNRTALETVNDVTGSALRGGARSLINSVTSLPNLVASGFNLDETAKKNEEALSALGLGQEDRGKGLDKYVDPNATASKVSNVAGEVAGQLPTIVYGQIAPAMKVSDLLSKTSGLSRLAATGTAGRVASSALSELGGGAVASASGFLTDPQQTGQDVAINAGIDAAIGIAAGFIPGARVTATVADDIASSGATTAAATADVARYSIKSQLTRYADEAAQTARQTDAELGAMGDGFSSPNIARVAREEAETAAQQSRAAADAVDTAIPSVQAPEVAPTVDVPQLQRVEQPQVTEAPVETPRVAAEDMPLDQTQRTIDEATVAPETTASPVEAQAVETPTQAESRAIAESTPPVYNKVDEMARGYDTPEQARFEVKAAEDELKQLRKAKASKEEIAQAKQRLADAREAAADSSRDPRLRALSDLANERLNAVDDVLSAEGKTYEDLVQKLYSSSTGGAPARLTDVERRAYDMASEDINQALKQLSESGIDLQDMGIRRQYLPTGQAGEFNTPLQVSDINRDSFTFARRREGTLKDSEVRGGARQAFVDYYTKGMGSKYLSSKQVDDIRVAKDDAEAVSALEFKDSNNNRVDLTNQADKEVITASNKRAVEAERARTDAQMKVAEGKASPKEYDDAVEAANQARIDAIADKMRVADDATKRAIAETKASDLSPAAKSARIRELEKHLRNLRGEYAYQQTYVKSNFLTQIPGRVADQIGKAVQSTGDAVTGILGDLGLNKSFMKTVGRQAFAGRAESRAAVKAAQADPRMKLMQNNLKLNKALNDASGQNKVLGDYKAYSTALTELGSRYKKPTEDVARFFVAQAKADGVDPADYAKYVTDRIGTKEWDRVYAGAYAMRNQFSGVPAYRTDIGEAKFMDKDLLSKGFDRIEGSVRDVIAKTNLPQGVQDNLVDAIRVPLIGFPRVVANVAAKGLDNASLGISDFWRAAKIDAVDEATALEKAMLVKKGVESAQAGGGMYALGYMAGANGMVTGPEGEYAPNGDFIPPYSIKLGNTYIEPGRFMGPYAIPFMLTAQAGAGNIEDAVGAIPAMLNQLTTNFGVDSIGDTLSDVGAALNGDFSGMQRYLGNITAAFAPLSSQISKFAQMADPYARETASDDPMETWMNQLKSKVPVLRETLPERLDYFGNPTETNPVSGVIPVAGTRSSFFADDSPLGSELNRLSEAGVDAGPKDMGTGNYRDYKLTGTDDKSIDLDMQQQNELDKTIGEYRRKQAELIIGSDAYKAANDEGKAKLLKSAYSTGLAAVANNWARSNGIEVKSTSVEGISDSLSDEYKTALISYESMDGDARKSWLEDAGNYRDYWNARYDNKAENGTLTADDKDTEKTGSLAYKAISGKVNAEFEGWTPELENLYENTSAKELAAMSDDDPNKALLLALDKARAEAGVSRKSSDKKSGKYSSLLDGSYGSGSKKSFSLPTIPAGATGPQTSTEQKYQAISKTRTSTLPTVAPAERKAKRSISVKRGVQL